MKFGLSLFAMSPENQAPLARRAEEVGFESVWIPEHLVFPAEIPATYPYDESGLPPVRAGAPLYDPWVILAYIASATERIRLGTSIYVLPLRHPIISARAITTLDVLSGGRVLVGVGVGWLREEFELVGEHWERRGARSEEILAILRKLWSERVIDHRGEFYEFGPLRFEPKPLQVPHPPLIIGGESPVALRRAARLGDGWISSGAQTLDELGEAIGTLRGLRREYGRDAEPFEATAFNRLPVDRDCFERHRELGVDRLVLMPAPAPRGPTRLEDALRFVEDCGELIRDQPSSGGP